MSKIFRATSLLTGTVLLASACGGDAFTNSGDPLVEAEAQAVSQEVMLLAFQVFGDLGAPAQGPAAASSSVPIPFSVSFDQSVGCAAGGTVNVSGSLSGSVDDETLEGNIELNITQTISACKILYENVEFTVNSSGIQYTGDISVAGETVNGTFSMEGGFEYTSTDGRAGTCSLSFTANFTDQSASGSACGQSFSVSFAEPVA